MAVAGMRVRPAQPPALARNGGRAALVAAILAAAILAPALAPYPPDQIDILNRLAAPSSDHWLGTDQMGRDVFSRLLHGGRLTIGAALLVVALSVAVGGALGALSGYIGGVPDRLLMRFCEAVSVMPALVITMVIAGVLGLGLGAVVVALAAVHWTEYARLCRNMVMVERTKSYVLAAEALGLGPLAILHRHLVPNIAGPILTLSTLSLSWVILAFAGLSFLGFGVEPGTAEWGRMIADARTHMRAYPRLVLAPGLTIMGFVLAINLLGDAVGDRLRGTRNNHLKNRN